VRACVCWAAGCSAAASRAGRAAGAVTGRGAAKARLPLALAVSCGSLQGLDPCRPTVQPLHPRLGSMGDDGVVAGYIPEVVRRLR
jgi:hypothetical protein